MVMVFIDRFLGGANRINDQSLVCLAGAYHLRILVVKMLGEAPSFYLPVVTVEADIDSDPTHESFREGK